MFQTIQERKAALSDLPNQSDTSVTEEDGYMGEWNCIRNLHFAIPYSLQYAQ
jgi:hypothetical protein